MARLRDSQGDLAALIQHTANSRNIAPAWIEKDFWVTEVIRSVATTQIADATLILKGGTSLLKAYSLIERMSEDVDVLLSYSASTGRGTRERALKEVHANALVHLGLDEAAATKEGSQEGTRRDIRYAYPGAEAEGGLSAGVLLELGIRGGPSPRDERTFRSMLADHAITDALVADDDYEELGEVTIQTLAPIRTLIEKLSALHHWGVTFPASQAKLLLQGRHLYDIAQLLGSAEIREQLSNDETSAVHLAQDVERVSEDNGWPFSPRPPAGFSDSPIFDTASPAVPVLRQAYADAAGLVFGIIPTFEECLDRVHAAAALL